MKVYTVRNMFTFLSERREVDLSFNDWLDGIQKTVHASIMAERDKESEGLSIICSKSREIITS